MFKYLLMKIIFLYTLLKYKKNNKKNNLMNHIKSNK
jgi:hypothetical protein